MKNYLFHLQEVYQLLKASRRYNKYTLTKKTSLREKRHPSDYLSTSLGCIPAQTKLQRWCSASQCYTVVVGVIAWGPINATQIFWYTCVFLWVLSKLKIDEWEQAKRNYICVFFFKETTVQCDLECSKLNARDILKCCSWLRYEAK